jgi:predicted nucleotidyltransferase
MPTPLEEMRDVAKKLQPLDTPFAFVGGTVMCLLVDHPELTQFRRTKEVDVVVGVVTYAAFAALEEKLRGAGFLHDISVGAPIVRWEEDGCRVDIMPQNSDTLGMNARWFPEALRLAEFKDLGEGCSAKCVSPPVFMATKFEAYKDRGKGDLYLSHDLADNHYQLLTLVRQRELI